ncbi:hypothetical protein BaRGS_00035570, partial [Batillaria attramentaria]
KTVKSHKHPVPRLRNDYGRHRAKPLCVGGTLHAPHKPPPPIMNVSSAAVKCQDRDDECDICVTLRKEGCRYFAVAVLGSGTAFEVTVLGSDTAYR